MSADRSSPRYEILNKIGEGGMGEVFLARDTTLERRVALKFLPERLQQDAVARARFLREAKSAAALDHPFICNIYEIGGEGSGADGIDRPDGTDQPDGIDRTDRPDGTPKGPFIAMEYVEGETLERRLQRGPLALNDALRLAAELAEALETAHGAGIVHRDLKPSNIMITESDHVKVMDFGLAKRVESTQPMESELETAARLTGTGVLMGTPAYMSPEQMRAEAVDRRSDIFSFGVVLYQMLTGTHPFAQDTSMDTIVAILTLATPPLSEQRQELPELLEHVVGKMTAKSPDKRYQHVREVRIDLEGVREQSGEGITTVARELRPASKTSSRARPGVGTVAVLALFLLALLVGTAWWINSSWWTTSMTPPGPQSVAFLPLINSSDDPRENNYIATGINGIN